MKNAVFWGVAPCRCVAAATCSRWFFARGFFYLKMEAIRSSETSVQSTTSTRRHTPEDGILQIEILLATVKYQDYGEHLV
jgi:hypothetical protein